MKKLSVIIVNYNVCYFLEQALLSVQQAIAKLGAPAEIFVVDNHSDDASVEMVQKRFPEVHLLVNEQNLGFAKANNQALRRAIGEYVLLLNPDTVVEEDAFLKCCGFMDAHPEAGGLGVKMLDGKGEYLPESKRGLPTPEVGFYKIVGLAKLFPRSEKFARYYLGHLDKDQVQEIDVLAGAFMFLRRSVLEKTGLLDEAFFMYGEDIDLSYRLRQAGYKNYYYPQTRIIHYKGESTRRSSLNYVFIFYNAMAIFYRKHFSGNLTWAYSFFIQFAIVLRAGVAILARFFSAILPFLDDAALIYAGLYGLKVIYEKQTGHQLPEEYMWQVVPMAISLWLGSVYFNGGYDKPFKMTRLMLGVLMGTILISALANFWQMAHSPGIIILWGGIWTLLALAGKRLLYHYAQYQDFRIGDRPRKRIAVVGSARESKRVIDLFRQTGIRAKIIGFSSPSETDHTAKDYLGEVSQLNDIIRVHKLNELIFCGRDLSVSQIIEWMVAINDESVQYKILPEGRDYIIGSSSKYTQGNYYAMQIELPLFKKAQVRNKRLLDFFLAVLFLLLAPLLLWLVYEKTGFLKNCLLVLSRNYSWVGIKRALQHYHKNKAVLTPADQFRNNTTPPDEQMVRQIEVIYAQTYSIKSDIEIILKAFRFLGRAA